MSFFRGEGRMGGGGERGEGMIVETGTGENDQPRICAGSAIP